MVVIKINKVVIPHKTHEDLDASSEGDFFSKTEF